MSVAITSTAAASTANAKIADTTGMTDAQLKSYVNNVPKNLYKAFGRWLILPEMTSMDAYRTTADKVKDIAKNKEAGFKGTFVPITEFGKHDEGEAISFTLLDPETLIGQIKSQISILTHVPKSEIQISFHGMRDLDNEMNFRFDLNCHGKGGENFWISRNEEGATQGAPTA